MSNGQKVTSLRLICRMSSVAPEAQSGQDRSHLELVVSPEDAGAQALQEVLALVKAAPVDASRVRPMSGDEEQAEISWEATQGRLQLRWADPLSHPWGLTQQVMKHLLLQTIRLRIVE